VSAQASAKSDGIAAVVVSYQSAATLRSCLAALAADERIAEIRVVDNGSSDSSVAVAREAAAADSRIAVLQLEGNPGFAAGCNAGAAASKSPWLLFVNPDLELPPGSAARLVAHARSLGALGLVGADLRDTQGRRDPAARRHDLSLLRLLRSAGRRGALDTEADDAVTLQPVDACSGALMLLSRAAFDVVDGFDAGYRLHVEDLDLCRRLREAGGHVAVANDVPVLHHRGVSSRVRPIFVEWHKHRGFWRYWWRFEASGMKVLLAPAVALVLCARLALAVPRRALAARSFSGSG